MPIVVASGTFTLKGRWLFATGSFVFNAGPPRRFEYQSIAGTPTAGTLQGSFPGDGVLTGTGGSWSPATLDTIPAGFLPTDNLRGRINIQNGFFPSFNIRLWSGLLCGESYGPLFVSGFDSFIQVVIPDNVPLPSLTGLVTASVSDSGGGSSDLAKLLEDDSIVLSGNYVIIVFWWIIPDVDACGNRNTVNPEESESHLVLASEAPSAAYQRFDPDDPDAAPQPIILNVVPNHGRAGTRVQIIGSGFGDGAEVEFDGVPALDIEVVSQYQILATAPAHANGFANIVVINPDGVTS